MVPNFHRFSLIQICEIILTINQRNLCLQQGGRQGTQIPITIGTDPNDSEFSQIQPDPNL